MMRQSLQTLRGLKLNGPRKIIVNTLKRDLLPTVAGTSGYE